MSDCDPGTHGNEIHPTARVHPSVRMGEGCIIGPYAQVLEGVELEAGVILESGVIAGYRNLTRIRAPEMLAETTLIGEKTLVRSGSLIYHGCVIGGHCHIGHGTVIREGTSIGHHTSLGNLVTCDGYMKIGMRCSIHAQTHLTSFMTIEDYVFIGASVVTMNDPAAAHYRDIKRKVEGPTIRYGARIGCGAVLCPRVRIGREAFIGAGAVVVSHVPDLEFWFGNPAKKVRSIRDSERLQPVGEGNADESF